ncbi:hypothetical protein GJ744_008880 [Endocarpon pusillum]|uniref:Heterokaryon incompatibility domain-containing protein n=1 Tax=Endocarpon pusillum TaxID=364733 RepID=A0A8H7AUU0_9EURO|nr:hypothetical protein GJ744_008880 [Endocarpon pusillum]
MEDVPQLALVTVTPKNKQGLLKNGIEPSERSIEDTQALMARLEQYDPATAQQFDFKDVAISKAPLRFLCAAPMRNQAMNGFKKVFGGLPWERGRSSLLTSTSTSDTRFNSFVAVSYCWRNQDWTPAPVCQPTEGWPISLMMLSDILDRKESRKEGLWIDALCIDQDNETEKMHAIGSMDLIYKNARVVVFLLEDVCLSGPETETLSMMFEPSRKPSLGAKAQLGLRILSSRWFTRAFCSQEFQFASNPRFMVPTESGPLLLDINDIESLYSAYSGSQTIPDSFPLLGFETLLRSAWYRSIHWYRRTPMAQFNGIIELGSTYAKDKIGIAANVAGIQLYFTGSEKSVHQCRWILAMLALSAGDLSSLCGTGPAIPIQLSADEEGFSWLRWNISPEDFVASLSPPTFPQRSHFISIHPQCTILELLVLENYTLRTPSAVSMLKATAFIDQDAIAKNVSNHIRKSEDPMSPKVQHRRRLCSEVLACSLDCGLTWLLNNLMFNQDVANEMQWKIELLKFDLWPLISNLLIDVYPLEESTISNFTSEERGTMTQSIFFYLSHMDLNHMPSYYDSGIFKSNEVQCLWLDWGAGHGKGLTFIGYGEAQLPECRLTVPTALGHPSCATMDRLWLLKSRDSKMGKEWAIIEKMKLVTLQPLEDDGRNLVQWAEQIIRA